MTLVKRLQQRDEAAYEQIIDKYSKLLWRVADGVLWEVCSEQDVEECVADVFFKLWQKPEVYDPKMCNLKNFLVVLTKNHAIDIYRRKVRRAENILDEEFCDENADPVNEVIKEENQTELNNALGTLSVCDKEIVTRRYIYEEKPSEISKAMNLPVRRIENRLYRAKQSLKKLLDPSKMGGMK